MKIKILLLVGLMLTIAGACPATQKTVTLTAIADADVRWTNDPADSDYAKGDRTTLYINYVTGTNNEAKAYVRFQLPADFGTASSATFSVVRVVMDAWTETYNVYGLKDSAAGNDWQDMSPGMYYGGPTGGLTWNNAPANDKTSGNGFTSDATAVLGTFTTVGSNNGGTNFGTYSVAAPDLASFLNTDSDKNVTLMIGRIGSSSSGAEFASKENGTYAGPTLQVTYEPNPAVITTTLTPVADADVRWTNDPADKDYAKGNRTTLYINYVTSTNNEAKAYIRYQLPSDFGTAISATFNIVRVVMDAWTETYNVYGLKDNAAGNDWQDQSPGMYYGAPSGGLTWNNAPANDKTSGNGFTSDATAVLGTFTTLGTNNGGTNFGTYSVSAPALVSFLNTDTDKNVTLMIGRIGDSSSGAEFASKENGTYAGPTLQLVYEKPCPLMRGDINHDCKIDFKDIAALSVDWLTCTEPNQSKCH